MLLFSGNSVLQVLEEDKRPVRKLFQSIELDSRHQNIFVLSKETIVQRQFASRAMGFSQLSMVELESYSFAAQVFKPNKDELLRRVVKPGGTRVKLVVA
jgi:hypothetical protein